MIRKRRYLPIRMLTALGVLLASGQVMADPVVIRGWTFPDYGRLVFDWENGAGYSVQRLGDLVTINFDRTIDGTAERAATNLQDYLNNPVISPDRESFTFALTPGAELRDFSVGTAVILDLTLPDNGQAQAEPPPAPSSAQTSLGTGGAQAVPAPLLGGTPPTPAPETPQSPPQASPQTGGQGAAPVRIGEHPTYSRVVIDWPRQVPYEVEEDGQVARFTFPDGAQTGALGPVASLQRFTGASVEGDTISFSLADGTSLRQFRNGNSVVVDAVTSQQAGSPAQANASPGATGSGAPAGQPSEGGTQTQAPGQAGGNAPAEGGTDGNEGAIALADEPSPQERDRSAERGEAGLIPSLTLDEEGSSNLIQTVETLIKAPSDFLAVEALATSEGIPPQRLAALIDGEAAPLEIDRSIAGVSVSRDLAPVAPEDLSGAPLVVETSQSDGTVTIRFPWQEPSAAAVFSRAGYVWIAFDQQRRIDLTALNDQSGVIVGYEQVPSPVGSLMRLRLVSGLSPRVWRDGQNWLIDLRAQNVRTEVPLEPEIQPISPQGPRVFIPVAGVGDSISITDPEVGDEIFIIPIEPLGRGLETARTFAQFSLPKTIQGVAVVPLSEAVTIRELPDGIAVTGEGGLFLSEDQTRDDTFGERGLIGGGSFLQGRPYPLEEWRLVSRNGFNQKRQELLSEVAEALSISKTRPRLQLARYYFAHGLTAETLGLLRTIAIDDPETANTPEFKSLRGAARFALGRPELAQEDLVDRSLDGNREVELWRGAAAGATGDWGAAAEHFARAGEVPGDYPRNYTTEIALLAAEAAVRVGDNRGAGVFLDVVAEGRPSVAENSRINYLRGRVLAAVGDIEGAYSLWRPLSVGEDRWSRVRAARALVEEDLRQGKVGKKEAIQSLEDLRFAWRGDILEFDLLKRLGGLYLDVGDFRSGLTILKEATSLFPNFPESPRITEEMSNAFARLFLDGRADKLTPINALSLFEDFRELTPVGSRGNEMIRRLSDRLVSVDLLDRAGKLLERQIEFRLDGVDKARVGAQLAVIRLLDRDSDGALNALNDSVAARLPRELALERRRLRARALADLDKTAEALELLEGDTSRDANLLRADVNWRVQDWARAADAFAELASDISTSSVSRQQASLILNWAVASSLAGDPGSVQLIRRRFGNAMDKSGVREAFRLITAGSGEALADFTQVAERFEEIRQFQGFLDSYRDRLSDEQLSAIN